MPTTTLRNLLYRAALPLAAPSPRGQMTHQAIGQPLRDLPGYEQLLCRHHVLGASLLLKDDKATSAVHTSTATPLHVASTATMYRVASITKMATALVTLMLVDDDIFTLDTPVTALLPDADMPALRDINVRHLLCHTSGLQDIPAYEQALRDGSAFHHVLEQPNVRAGLPGSSMVYCNFGFGLLGCIMEHTTGICLENLFQTRLFQPLGMRATLSGSVLDEASIMPISRVLPYHAGHDVTITQLGRMPLMAADPLCHFGYTAGSMYTDCVSLSHLLELIVHDGAVENAQLVSPSAIRAMTTEHARTANRRYGLGLVLLERPDLSTGLILGHQGFAYGCVDGAFFEANTGRQIIFLNGGASEAREGRLGLVNRDILAWALKKEMPAWM